MNKSETRSTMYQRILVAVDGSPISKHALREAVRLAKVSHSVLRIVHMVDLVNIDFETSADQSACELSVREPGEHTLKAAAAVAHKAGVHCRNPATGSATNERSDC